MTYLGVFDNLKSSGLSRTQNRHPFDPQATTWIASGDFLASAAPAKLLRAASSTTLTATTATRIQLVFQYVIEVGLSAKHAEDGLEQ